MKNHNYYDKIIITTQFTDATSVNFNLNFKYLIDKEISSFWDQFYKLFSLCYFFLSRLISLAYQNMISVWGTVTQHAV